ncbi:MAG: glycosyltransferase [Myxococcota bacterium]
MIESSLPLRGVRVLMLDSSLVRSGAENLRLYGCRGLRAAGAELHELVLGEPGDIAEQLEQEGLATVHRAGTGDSVTSVKPALAIRALVKSIQPQVVLASRVNCAAHAVAALRGRWRLSLPRLVVEVMSTDDWMRLPHKVLWAAALHSAHLVTACSRTVGERLRSDYRVPEARIETVTVGTDIHGLARPPRAEARLKLGITDDRPVVGSVGTLRAPKRYDKLLRAMQALERRTSLSPWIVLSGHGPERERLAELGASLGLSSRLKFAERSPNVGVQYAALDVFVLSSDFEGFPLVIPEAMSMRVPIVATSVSGVPDVIHHGENGLLVGKDDIEAMERAIEVCLQGGPEVERRLQRAAEDAEAHYTSERYGERMVAAVLRALR